MTSLSIKLEARSPAHRCHRAYEIAVSADLFGAWLVEMSYGRIGALVRTKARSFSTADAAAAEVKACMRKRASAPRRIGVAYRLKSAAQHGDWHWPDLDERLCAWFPRSGNAPSCHDFT
ncbi:WGR domain-containing protein [Acidisphaera sp. S103]|uniref:WGR domain-containing protein n=1 Tax=Acidisphaera sp. S103 TaxID=1747223 RepID=UPI00131C6F77|nr:WGR domain-containing protein [Acidisphaera sp. S103]